MVPSAEHQNAANSRENTETILSFNPTTSGTMATMRFEPTAFSMDVNNPKP